MTAKENAKELFDKYLYIIEHHDSHWYTDLDAKDCSKLAVDEIISACEYNNVEVWNTDWWNKVKQEIELL